MLSTYTATSAARSTPTKTNALSPSSPDPIPKNHILTVVVDDTSPSGMLWPLQTQEVWVAHTLMKISNAGSAKLPLLKPLDAILGF